MKRIIFTIAILFTNLIYGQTADPPSNYGDIDAGTSANPYRIATLNNLYWISDQVSNSHNLFSGKYFIQTNDINAVPCSTWFSNTGFPPIGNDSYPFEGNYDGQNHVITSLRFYHNDYATGGFALFGRTSGSSISNLGITDASVNTLYGTQAALCGINNGSITNCYATGGYLKAGAKSGGLIGQNNGGDIINCYATVYMDYTGSFTGGLIGELVNGNVNNCYHNATINVQPEASYIGGLVGNMYNGTITDSYSTGTFATYGALLVGGLVGETDDGIISHSFSSSNIVAYDQAGGFCGYVGHTSIQDCYSTGNVSNSSGGVGGIAGFMCVTYGPMTNCYSTGSVSPVSTTYPSGGFSAEHGAGAIINCFYNTDGFATSPDGTGKTTAEMKNQATYTSWDFTDVWGINISINNGYPYLIQKAAITGTNLLSSGITPGTSKPIVSLAFSSVLGVPYITSIKVDRTGTATDLDIPSASLWIDNNKNNVVDATDVQLGTTQSFSSGTLTFSGLNYWPNTINNLLIVYNADPGANTSHTAGASVPGNYITGANTTGITFAGITAGAQPLPVELTSFTAAAIDKGAELKWQTSTEVNNYGFDVERSLVTSQQSLARWEKVGFVPGAGNSNSPKEYSFIDVNPVQGNAEYRLKQIDLDGKFKYYSQTAKINFLTAVKEKQIPKEFGLSQNYPNPFNPSTLISYSIPENPLLRGVGGVLVTLKVYDILGNEVTTLVNENKAPGYYNVNFNAGNLSSGVYIYRLTAGKFISTKKLMLMK